ncbi:MAG TPA: hypothetical protein VF163_05500 [Micromonosporaceae bacterium]
MTTHTTSRPKKNPSNPTVTSQPRSFAVNLINEAMSRARMRSPQTVSSEARRSARRIAMQARRQQAREIGNISQFGVR